MQFIRFLSLAAAAGVALLASGCASEDIVTALPKDPAERSLEKAVAAPVAHKLAPGDRVRVTVYDLTAQITENTIDETGTLAVPPLKPLDVKGMAPRDAAERIAMAFAESGLFRNAPVTVDVISYGRIYLLGEVTKPGEYDYRPGMSLFAAVATAGGHTYRANRGHVFIRRANEAIETEYECRSDLAIHPGDVIRIPEWRL
jgi:polysaccharide export outer membrane protein